MDNVVLVNCPNVLTKFTARLRLHCIEHGSALVDLADGTSMRIALKPGGEATGGVEGEMFAQVDNEGLGLWYINGQSTTSPKLNIVSCGEF